MKNLLSGHNYVLFLTEFESWKIFVVMTKKALQNKINILMTF